MQVTEETCGSGGMSPRQLSSLVDVDGLPGHDTDAVVGWHETSHNAVQTDSLSLDLLSFGAAFSPAVCADGLGAGGASAATVRISSLASSGCRTQCQSMSPISTRKQSQRETHAKVQQALLRLVYRSSSAAKQRDIFVTLGCARAFTSRHSNPNGGVNTHHYVP